MEERTDMGQSIGPTSVGPIKPDKRKCSYLVIKREKAKKCCPQNIRKMTRKTQEIIKSRNFKIVIQEYSEKSKSLEIEAKLTFL